VYNGTRFKFGKCTVKEIHEAGKIKISTFYPLRVYTCIIIIIIKILIM